MSESISQKPAEESHLHTRLMRFGLGVDAARAYWSRVDGPSAERDTLEAFGQRWFGAVSETRTDTILRNMRARFDAFPSALRALSVWQNMRPATRILICHWHLQLSDPLYRGFTGEFLVQRREGFDPTVDRDRVMHWVNTQQPDRWAPRTRTMVASKLLSAAHAAGLVETNRDPRPLVYPRVPDPALAYILHLLREVDFEGTLIDNPYLRSVGLSDKFLEDRLRTLPGVELRRMGDLVEFSSASEDLETWATQFCDASEAS